MLQTDTQQMTTYSERELDKSCIIKFTSSYSAQITNVHYAVTTATTGLCGIIRLQLQKCQ